jgi:hypothetical protein
MTRGNMAPGKKWLRRVGPHGGSLTVAIPAPLLSKYKIRSGDYILLQDQGDTITLTLFEEAFQSQLRTIEGSTLRSRPGHSQARIKYRSLT